MSLTLNNHIFHFLNSFLLNNLLNSKLYGHFLYQKVLSYFINDSRLVLYQYINILNNPGEQIDLFELEIFSILRGKII